MSDPTESLILEAAAENPLPELEIGSTFDGYTIVAKRGDGVLATLWDVTDANGNERLLELIREELVQEIDHESVAGRASRMRGALPDAVLLPLDVGEENEHAYFVTEAPSGPSLRSILDSATGPLPKEQLLDIFLGLLNLLRETHKKIRHGGLDANNVFVGEGRDISIGQLVTYSMAEGDAFGPGGLNRDSAHYLPPELEQYTGRADATADVYSVGVLLYEALCGERPEGRYEMPSALHKELPAEVDDVIELALAPNPRERFQSADDLAMAIENAFTTGGAKADEAQLAKPLIFGLIALLVIAAGVVFMLRPEAEEDLLAKEMERRTALRADVATKQTNTPAPGTRDGMAWVPGGPFIAGRFAAQDPLAGASERAEQVIEVGGFWIDVAPVQVPDGDGGDFKIVNGMTQDEARRICEKFGKRLCSADEWEKACKGPESSVYSYGDVFDAQRCPPPGFNNRYRVADYPDCVSGYGVIGMSGGVGEWTSTQRGDRYVIKPSKAGGAETYSRCAGQAELENDRVDGNIGMRCCAD